MLSLVKYPKQRKVPKMNNKRRRIIAIVGAVLVLLMLFSSFAPALYYAFAY